MDEDTDFGKVRFQKCVPIGGYLEHFWLKKYIRALFGGVAVRSIKKALTLVHYLSRSVFGGLLAAKFSKFFYRGS